MQKAGSERVLRKCDNIRFSVRDRAISLVQAWSPRKRDLFKESHLRKAWERLQTQGWFEIKE